MTVRQQLLTEDDVAEVLESAVRKDRAQDGHTAVEKLREAALEVGISPTAFDEAMDEFRLAARVPDVSAPTVVTRPKFFSQVRTALSVASRLFIGLLGGNLVRPGVSREIIALAALIVVGRSQRLVLSHRKDRSLLPYILDSFWLWTSFGVGVSVASGFIGEESIISTVIAIAIAWLVGGVFIKIDEVRGKPTRRIIRLELLAPSDRQ